MARYIQGRFRPSNPHKYKGDPTGIIYRSSLELTFMMYVDKHPQVEWWASEEMCVEYLSPKDLRKHRYFPDFILKTIDGLVTMVEIKPAAQCQAPTPSTKSGRKKPQKQFINEVMTYGVNQAKWAAAESYCNKKGWKFKVMTESDLGR